MRKKYLIAMLLCAAVPVCSAAAEMDVEYPRTITVSGQAEVNAEPDHALVTLGIEARKLKLEEARAEVSSKVEAVLKLTREMKIDPKHVRTTRINVQPEYNWENNGRERQLLGYYVSRQVEVDLRDLEKLGTLLERAFDLGVNQMGDPVLDSSKRRELEREALARAIEDARMNAEAVAKAARARLGQPRTITANSAYVPPPVPLLRQRGMAAMEAADSAAKTYQAGQMGFTGTVQVQYDLIPE